MSSLHIHVVSDKEKEVNEMIHVIESVGTCTFRKRGTLTIDREEIVTVPSEKPISLLALRKNMRGWNSSNRKHYMFEKALEIYENNQSYYLAQLENETGMTKSDIIEGLTDLECWFSLIIEPHPRIPPKRKGFNTKKKLFIQEMEEWLVRENEKYKRGRSYYCDENAIQFLDRERLKELRTELFNNYEKVKQFFKEYEGWDENV